MNDMRSLMDVLGLTGIVDLGRSRLVIVISSAFLKFAVKEFSRQQHAESRNICKTSELIWSLKVKVQRSDYNAISE